MICGSPLPLAQAVRCAALDREAGDAYAHTTMLTRSLRQSIGRILIGVMLASQFMVAAYACPSETLSNDSTAATPGVRATPSVGVDRGAAGSVEAGSEVMVDCGQMAGMDPATPNLCHEHCQQGKQSDYTPVPAVAAAAPGGFYVLEPARTPRGQRLPSGAMADRLVVAFPPHTILHCCSRV